MAAGPVASTRTRVPRSSSRPRGRDAGRPAAEQVEGVPRDGQVALGGHRRQSQGEGESPVTSASSRRTTSSRCSRCRARPTAGRRRAPPPRSRRRRPAGALGAGPGAAAAPGVVALPGHGAAGRGHRVHQLVGVDHAHRLGHLLLLLEQQLVELPSRPAVQLDPGGRQHRPGVLEGHGVDVVGQDRARRPSWPAGRRCPAGRRGTPSGRARAGSRRRRWRRWRSATLSARTPSHGGFWRAQRSLAPSRTGSATLASPQMTRASSRPSATRRSSAGHVEGLGRLADAVVEGDPLVPDRVPDAVGGGRDVLAALVDEHHVEVAERAEFAPSVATDGHQGHAPGVAPGRLVEEAGEPLVGRRRVGPAEGVTLQVGRSMSSWRRARRPIGGPYHRAAARSGFRGRYAGTMADDEGLGAVHAPSSSGRRRRGGRGLVPARPGALGGQPGVGRWPSSPCRGGPGGCSSWWLLVRADPTTERRPAAAEPSRPAAQADIDSNSSMCSATMRWVEK